MTKLDIAKIVSEQLGIQLKDGETAVQATFQTVIDSVLAGDRVTVRGLGTWGTKRRKARPFRLPKTGEIQQLPAKNVPFFKPSKKLCDSVAGKGF